MSKQRTQEVENGTFSSFHLLNIKLGLMGYSFWKKKGELLIIGVQSQIGMMLASRFNINGTIFKAGCRNPNKTQHYFGLRVPSSFPKVNKNDSNVILAGMANPAAVDFDK